MAEITVVGAGLSGLVAAINCVRAGHDVTVLEKNSKVGGEPVAHPGIDGTPMRPEELGRFIGVELKAPQVTPSEELCIFAYGRKFEFDPARNCLYSVERGARSSAIDNYLYEIAVEEGVKFEFGWELGSKADLSQLPPKTILASGLSEKPFKLLGIPYRTYDMFIDVKRHEGPNRTLAWFDSYATLYCYCGTVNGLAVALYIGTDDSIVEGGFEEWSTRHLPEQSGIEFTNFRPFSGVLGTKKFNTNSLFYGDKILAGSLAGANDAFFGFGVHPSLISGKIAAMAVDDGARASELFDDLVCRNKYFLALRKLSDAAPHSVKKVLWRSVCSTFTLPAFEPLQGFLKPIVPGFSKLKKWQQVS